MTVILAHNFRNILTRLNAIFLRANVVSLQCEMCYEEYRKIAKRRKEGPPSCKVDEGKDGEDEGKEGPPSGKVLDKLKDTSSIVPEIQQKTTSGIFGTFGRISKKK